MDAADRERLHGEILADIRRHDEAIEGHRASIEALEAEKVKLKMLADYLRPATAEAHTIPTAARTEQDALLEKLQGVTPEEIAETAVNMMSGTRGTARALDVARALVPEYDPEVDTRNFENRIYSLLDRQKNRFVRISRGLFSLKAPSPPLFQVDVGNAEVK